MLKTIKKVKQLRLDELLKLCWDSHITSGIYRNKRCLLQVFDSSNVVLSGSVSATDTFEVQVEEEITEETKFDLLLELWLYDGEYRTYSYINRCIGQLKDSNTVSIYALIDGKLQLIWERENQ